MIVDTSALVAILRYEPERLRFAQLLDEAEHLRMSAASYLELSIVIDSRKDVALSREIEELIERFEIIIEPVTVEQARIARQAYRDYGKASGHPANLNFGDCFSYALARAKREPILFKGDDFGFTDLRPATQS
ncbi:MAG TPA: type II toxin-antitoxin system VapC family toxin [Terracidiphilus sp.]|jgi:ribonuclease VapC